MKKKIDPNQIPTIPSLIGKNIYLRPAEPADYKITYQWFLASDPQSQTCHQAILTTPDEAAENRRRKEPAADRGDFLIIRIEDDQPVGKLGSFGARMILSKTISLNTNATRAMITIARIERKRCHLMTSRWSNISVIA